MTGILLNRIAHSAVFALIASITIVSLVAMSFMMAEPAISYGQVLEDTSTFTVRQQITDESSFTTNASNVTMVGSLNGVTGGNATGTTGFTIRTNNATGWHVTIDFFDNAGAHAMYGESDGDESLRDYGGDVVGEPSYNFTASTAAQFAYSVQASSSLELDQSFLDNATNACNSNGGGQTAFKCWKAPSTSEFQILDSDSAAATGASSTVTFNVRVPNNPSPGLTAQWYTATATLSLYTH